MGSRILGVSAYDRHKSYINDYGIHVPTFSAMPHRSTRMHHTNCCCRSCEAAK